MTFTYKLYENKINCYRERKILSIEGDSREETIVLKILRDGEFLEEICLDKNELIFVINSMSQIRDK
jgi:hypothetical protein